MCNRMDVLSCILSYMILMEYSTIAVTTFIIRGKWGVTMGLICSIGSVPVTYVATSIWLICTENDQN
ncbi:hypothetical protein J3F84DRAFT_289832 [Trichoderma pleuroticola]